MIEAAVQKYLSKVDFAITRDGFNYWQSGWTVNLANSINQVVAIDRAVQYQINLLRLEAHEAPTDRVFEEIRLLEERDRIAVGVAVNQYIYLLQRAAYVFPNPGLCLLDTLLIMPRI